jgi:hypothetical protein
MPIRNRRAPPVNRSNTDKQGRSRHNQVVGIIKEVIGNRDVLVGRLGSPISAVLIKAESVSVPQRSVAAA